MNANNRKNEVYLLSSVEVIFFIQHVFSAFSLFEKGLKTAQTQRICILKNSFHWMIAGAGDRLWAVKLRVVIKSLRLLYDGFSIRVLISVSNAVHGMSPRKDYTFMLSASLHLVLVWSGSSDRRGNRWCRHGLSCHGVWKKNGECKIQTIFSKDVLIGSINSLLPTINDVDSHITLKSVPTFTSGPFWSDCIAIVNRFVKLNVGLKTSWLATLSSWLVRRHSSKWKVFFCVALENKEANSMHTMRGK